MGPFLTGISGSELKPLITRIGAGLKPHKAGSSAQLLCNIWLSPTATNIWSESSTLASIRFQFTTAASVVSIHHHCQFKVVSIQHHSLPAQFGHNEAPLPVISGHNQGVLDLILRVSVVPFFTYLKITSHFRFPSKYFLQMCALPLWQTAIG